MLGSKVKDLFGENKFLMNTDVRGKSKKNEYTLFFIRNFLNVPSSENVLNFCANSVQNIS